MTRTDPLVLEPGGPHPPSSPAPHSAGFPHQGTSALRGISWTARATVFAATGAVCLGRPGVPDGVAAVYAACGAALAWWATLDVTGRLPARRAGTLPMILGVTAVLAGAVSGLPHAIMFLAVAAIAVLEAGSETSTSAGIVVTAAGVLAVEAGALVAGAGPVITVGGPLVLLIAVLTGNNRCAYRLQAEQTQALLDSAHRLRVEQRQVAALDERSRIAREIHDVLAHSLGALSIQIQAARILVEHGDLKDAVARLEVAQHLAVSGLAETRGAVHALRSGTLRLDQELARMVAQHQHSHASGAVFDVSGDPRPLSPDRTVALARTAREALTNAAKHSPGREVTVSLTYAPEEITLTVSNPLGPTLRQRGRASAEGGYGLIGMGERLALQNGALEAGVEQGLWTVTAKVPQ